MKKVLAIMCLGAFLLGGCKRETKDERFKREYEQFTRKECPKEVASCIRMDSICYDIESRTLTEYYTFTGNLDTDSFYTEKVVDEYRKGLLKELKGSLQMKPQKDEGINFSYKYHSDTTGKLLFEMAFTPEDYNN